MKIISLLPSATEIVFALGLGDSLEGVTHECDYPAEARDKPVVMRPSLPSGPLSSREIDDAVRAKMDAKEPLYVLDRSLIQRVQPDVILTQDLCRVCSIATGQVEDALADLGVDAKVLSLDPNTLDEIFISIEAVGKLVEREDAAKEITEGLRARVEAVKKTSLRLPTIRVLAQEWLDPPFAGGHWVPEMIREVYEDRVTYGDPPHKFEAGTPAIVQAIGLGTAVDYVNSIGKARIRAHEAGLVKYAHERLREINRVRIFGTTRDKGPIVAFDMQGAHPHDVATIIDRSGVAVRAGTHCTMPLLARYGVTATCRASFGLYNTRAEVDSLAQALIKAQDFFA